MRFFFKILIFITFTNIKLGYSQITSHEKRSECYKNIENWRKSSEESAINKYYSPNPGDNSACDSEWRMFGYICNSHRRWKCGCKECYSLLQKEYSEIESQYKIELENCQSSYEVERKRDEEIARKREEEVRKRKEEERKRKEEEKKKREEEERKRKEKEKNSKSKSKRKDSNSSSYLGGYIIEDPAKERFNKDKQNAIDEKIKQDIKDKHDIALATELTVTSIGFYLYNPPKQRYYNARGCFLSLGPQNSLLNIPVVSIKESFREDLINYNYSNLPTYSKKEITIEPLVDDISVPTIGAGMSLGYIGDNINFSLPINGSFGLFSMSQMSLNYGYGFNLFAGSPNFKIGIGTDFNYYSLTKNDFNATDNQNSYTTSRISFDSEASLVIKKLGIRFQKNMNSNSTNLELPKIVDLYFLFSNTNIDKSSNLFDFSLDSKDYGFEIVYNIYGKIGFTFKYLRINPIVKINEPFDLFNKSSYFQIGVKKDYTWFKSY